MQRLKYNDLWKQGFVLFIAAPYLTAIQLSHLKQVASQAAKGSADLCRWAFLRRSCFSHSLSLKTDNLQTCKLQNKVSFDCRDGGFTLHSKRYPMPDSVGVDSCRISSSCKWYIMKKEACYVRLQVCNDTFAVYQQTENVPHLTILKGGIFSPVRFFFQTALTVLWAGMWEKEMCFIRWPRISSECGKHWIPEEVEAQSWIGPGLTTRHRQ